MKRPETIDPRPVAPLQDYLPFDRMPWEGFQKFGDDIIQSLREFTSSQPYGVVGSTQRGIDSIAALVTGETWTVQYKRVKTFSKRSAQRVKDLTAYQADKHLVVVSCDASVGAVDILSDDEWEIWDNARIRGKLRSLPTEVARAIIKRHFGDAWVESFLGISPTSIFQSTGEYFAGFTSPGSPFTHHWPLSGRTKEIQRLLEFSGSRVENVFLLEGRGGIGKSKLLYEFGNHIDKRSRKWSVRFVSPHLDPQIIGISDLPETPIIVVIDDAHRYEFLDALVAMLKQRQAPTKVIIATRPSGTQRVRTTLRLVSPKSIATVELKSLSYDDRQVLASSIVGDGHPSLVRDLTALMKDSPLMGVLAGYLLRESGEDFSQALNDEHIRDHILGSFYNDIIGRVAAERDSAVIEQLLQIIALLSPIPQNDDSVRSAIANCLGISKSVLQKHLGTLTVAEVIANRNGKYQIKPDLLSDFVLDKACIAPDRTETGFVEEMFDQFPRSMRLNILRNVAALDWRINSTGSRESQLLDALWIDITKNIEGASAVEFAEILRGLEDTAFYQADRVVTLLKEWLLTDHGRQHKHSYGVIGPLCQILRNAASDSPVSMRASIRILWSLAKEQFDRGADEKSNVPFRALLEMSGYDLHRSTSYSRCVLECLIPIFKRISGLREQAAALSILAKYLAKSQYGAYAQERHAVWYSFKLHREHIGDMRDTALALMLSFSDATELSLVVKFIGVLRECLKDPFPAFNLKITPTDLKQWGVEQLQIIDALANIRSKWENPVVDYLVVDALSWHRRYSAVRSVRSASAALIDSVTPYPDLLCLRAILCREQREAYGKRSPMQTKFERSVEISSGQYHAFYFKAAAQFAIANPSPSGALSALETVMRLSEMIEPKSSPHMFLSYLAARNVQFATRLCRELLVAQTASTVCNHISGLLWNVRRRSPEEFFAIAELIFSGGSLPALQQLLLSYCGFDWGTLAEQRDLDLFERFMALQDTTSRQFLFRVLWSCSRDVRFVLDNVFRVSLESSDTLAIGFCEVCAVESVLAAISASADHLELMCHRLRGIDSIDPYEIRHLLEVLGRTQSFVLIDLLLDRILQSENGKTYPYEPLPIYEALDLSFIATSPEYPEILQRVLEVGKLNPTRHIADLWTCLTRGADTIAMPYVQGLLDSDLNVSIRLASVLLSAAPKKVILDNPRLVSKLLDWVFVNNPDEFEDTVDNLLSPNMLSFRSRVVGQPSAEDVDLLQRTSTALTQVLPSSHASALYRRFEQQLQHRIQSDTETVEW